MIDLANRWTPYDVREAATLSAYSDEAAWEFIADCLAGETAVNCKPPTDQYPDHAYEFVEEDENGTRIYMKIVIKPEFGKKIIGVSFHHARS